MALSPFAQPLVTNIKTKEQMMHRVTSITDHSVPLLVLYDMKVSLFSKETFIPWGGVTRGQPEQGAVAQAGEQDE